MGVPYAKQKRNDSFTEDTKNGAAKEAAANEATDFNHGKANLKNTANTSQGPGPTQGISHQIEPNNGNEAVLTSMLQVPAADAQNREQSLNKAVNKSQDMDPIKIDPYIFTAERHASSANPPGRVMKIPKGANDDLSVFSKHKPPAPVKQKTKPVQQQTKPVQQQQNTTSAVQQQTKPVQQQTKPVQQQTKPVQQQTKPVPEQAKPVQQQTKPVQQQTKPVQQQQNTTSAVQQQTKPVQEQQNTTSAVQQQTKPVQQQTKPVQQQQNTTSAVQQQTKPVQQQTKPVQQQTKPVQEQAKPVQQQTKPVQQQTKPVQQQTKPVQEQTKPVQQQQKITAAVQQQSKPVQEQTKPVKEQAKPVKEQLKPVQEQTKPVQEQTKPVQEQTKPVQQQTEPVQQQTKPVQQQKKAPSPVLHVTVSCQRQQTAQTVPPCDMATADSAHTSQVAAQGLCRYGLHRVEHSSSQLPASQMQASVHRLYSDVVRGVPTENPPRGTKAQITLLRQKYNCALTHVNEVRTNLTYQATDKTHNTAEQSTAISPGMAEVPPDHSTQESHQSESQVNINALHPVIEHCVILTQRRREPAEGTVTTEQESSEQQYYIAVEETTIQTNNEPKQISKPNKADDTNENASPCILKVNVEALELQVPAVEGMPTTAPNNATAHPTTAAAETSVKSGLDPVSIPQDTDVKLETLNKNQPDEKTRNVTLKEEMNAKDGQVVKEEQEPAVHCEGRRHPFKVNQSCPHGVRRNPGIGLPPNVQKWCDEPPYHLCEPPWVTTARLAAFLALTKAQEERGDPPQ